MKSNFHFHFYSRIGISLLIFAFGFFLLQQSVSTTAQVSPADNIELTGWAWNEQVGWISLNCKNDFNGDGLLEDTCGPLDAYGYRLKVANIFVDATTTPHIQGCAWAGTANSALAPSAGWLCFSNPVGATTNAPVNGIPIRQADWHQEYYPTCSVAPGNCSVDASACNAYESCAVGWCIQPLFQGVCYNSDMPWDYPLVGSPSDLIGSYDPYNPSTYTDWDTCYTSAECPDLGTPGGDKCFFPQVNNRGICMKNGVSRNVSCTFDYDCLPDEGCKIETEDFIIDPPEDCPTGICSSGYTCIQEPLDTYIAYPNALDYPEFGAKASWLKIAESGAPAGWDLVGFPIEGELQSSATPLPSEDTYDPDNPNLFNSYRDFPELFKNPINGCFNCYQEEVKSCSPYVLGSVGKLCSTDADCSGTCVSDDYCRNNPSKSCTQLTEAVDCQEACNIINIYKKCDNCLEYFFYKDEPVNRCSTYYQIPCYGDTPEERNTYCTNNSGGTCTAYLANKRCQGWDYAYCNNNDDCLLNAECGQGYCQQHTWDSCNVSTDCSPGYSCWVGQCVLSPQQACSIDADCPTTESFTCSTRYCANKTGVQCTTDIDCAYGPCITQTPGTLGKVLAGYTCSDCFFENIENSCALNTYNQNINRCATCEQVFKTPGVILDNHNNRLSSAAGQMANLCGWAWNANSIGWINFAPAITTSTNPYFSVEQGNIYGQKNILSLYHPPFRKYNASYLIESGGLINNLVSSSTISEVFQGEMSYRPFLNFLQAISGKYQNVLGTLDYTGLITPASQKGGNDINKFGGQIVSVTDAGTLTSFFTSIGNSAFNNKVFHIESGALSSGVLTIADSIEIKAGQAMASGSGIIVVEGDLKIGTNTQTPSIKYETVVLPKVISYLKNIPSIVWVVKGDVILDPGVTELAGTFVVLGDGVNNCAIIPPAIDPEPHCGQFVTGTTAIGSDQQLKVTGSVLARRFSLDRRYVSTVSSEPAEKFINDGRLQANPPLGLVDFSKAVPRFGN